MTLDQIPFRQGKPLWVKIIAFCGSRLLNERLREMGFFEGLEFEVTGRLPLRGPWLLQLENSNFSLRDSEASAIQVEVRLG